MKRIFFLLLVCALLLTGCGDPATDIGVTEPMPEPEVTVVHSVDELLAAIAPGATIELAEGAYDLSLASDYGERKGPYYIWTDLGPGEYGLQIQYMDDLTIRGQGKDKTKLLTCSQFAHVLSIVDSRNVTLEDMTLGHRERSDACEGGVVYTAYSSNLSLRNLGLYGCGAVGVWGYECQDMQVKDCEIYDCSMSAVSLSQCGKVSIRSCDIHSLGNQMPVSGIFEFWTCGSVAVENCSVWDNYTYSMILSEGGKDVAFRNNRFDSNRVAAYAFGLTGGVTFENNTFQDIDCRIWYANGTEKAVDPEGNSIEFEAEEKPIEPGVAEAVSTGEQKEVTVSTVDQFLAAIAPDTKIILAEGEYNLSQAKNYGKETQYCYWEDTYVDGYALVIHGITNLTIQGAGQGQTVLSAVPRYANVLTFENCFGITVKDLTAGHTIEPGYCSGGVLLYRCSDSLLVENCGLYGCGTYGVQTESSANLQIVNCEIYECSYGGVWFQDSENITISGTTFRDLEGPVYHLWNCHNITANGDALDGNYTGD